MKRDTAENIPPLPGVCSQWFEGYDRYDFDVGGRPVTLIAPREPLQGRRWVWKGEFLDSFPGTELALLRKGFHIAYLSYPDQFGGPLAMAAWSRFYHALTERYGFARKFGLIGLSRGGLYCYQWAIANPASVACLYGDAPVCDLKSWPGGKGKGPGSPAEWQKVMEVFGFRTEEDAMVYPGNPVDNLGPLASARIPIMHVYGDADEGVPWDENTGVVARRYRELGGSIELIGKPGCGHHPHGLEDPTPVVEFFFRHAAGSDGKRIADIRH